MGLVIVFCDECQKETENEIIEIKESEDCWKMFVVKCKECGTKKDLNFYC